MFDNLSERLNGILDRLTRRGALSEADVEAALREVRRALLEADVALDVARSFTDQVKQRAVGVDVIKSVTPGQMVVKIVHDQLIETLGSSAEPIDLNAPAPVVIMMVGLQGSGKTTTTAKIAKRLTDGLKRKVLMASLDTRRPAAMEQLAILGKQVNVETLPIVEGQAPVQIAARAQQAARLGGYDVVLLDTAGRLTLDEELMREAAEVRRAANPHEVLLVADALTGQDAVNLAKSFNERLDLTGIVLTRIDGDGRGGAALVDARGHRQADQAHRHRRKARRAGGLLSAAHRRPHSRHGRHHFARRKGRRDHRRREGGARRRENAQGRIRSCRSARATRADANHGRHDRTDGDAARRRQDEKSAGRAQSRRNSPQAADGDHRFDDAAGTQESRRAQSQPQAPHRRRLRHQARGHQ